ncbi:MAG: BrnT family toxin [Accumulibacter sp.]|uniref:BrnT family toxin n=1 Tax=Accumulibacter sp. TaxID=2053492 RepID=UPI003315B757
MRVDFDPTKNERNIKERQLSFERVAEVDFNTALVFPDTRKAYGETRSSHCATWIAGCMCCVLPRPRQAFG